MRRSALITVITIIGLVGIYLGVSYFHSLSKINKSFSRFVTDKVTLVLKSDNLSLLKNHIEKSFASSTLNGSKELDLAFREMYQLDSVFRMLEVPFEYYNNFEYYSLIESTGNKYLIIEAPYQIDKNVFFEYLRINKNLKEGSNVYQIGSNFIFLKGRFAIYSSNKEFLSSINENEPDQELEALISQNPSASYCQIFQKDDSWSFYDVLIERKFIQFSQVEKSENEIFGAYEDKEMFYFIPNNIFYFEWVKSKSLIREFQRIYQHDKILSPELLSWVNNSMACFETKFGSYLLVKTRDDVDPSNQLESATINYSNISPDSIERFKINEHRITKFDPGENYNTLFGNDHNYKWYAELSNYVVFADSKTAIAKYFEQFDAGELINFDPDYSHFATSFPSNSNFIKISNSFDTETYPGSLFGEGVLLGESISFSKQFIFKNKSYYMSEDVKDEEGGEGLELFSVELPFEASYFAQIPNHLDGGLAYFVCSKEGKSMLLDKNGNVLWKANVDGEILGQIKVIDLFGNNKKQIVFNTKTKLYVLDIKGDNVASFPYVIPEGASNEVSILDYDQNNNYRFLIATNENKVLNIDEEGRLVQGWEFGETSANVQSEIHHFSIAGKDYIFFSDINGGIYLLNRRGQDRMDEKVIGKRPYHFFQKGQDIMSTRLFAVGDDKIYTLNLDGHEDSIDLEIEKPFKFIDFKDYNYDGLKEFVFTTKGYVNIVNQFGLISRQIPSPTENISQISLVYSAKDLENIVLYDYLSQGLYITDITGTVMEGMPLKCKKYLGTFQTKKNIVNCVLDENYLRLVQN